MSEYRGNCMTVLSVRLPIKLVGALYNSSIDKNRDLSVIVFQALETFLNDEKKNSVTQVKDGSNDKPIKRKMKDS